MKQIIYILGLAVVLSGCRWIEHQKRDGVVAEVNGQMLLQSDVDDIVRAVSREDSAAVAKAYIYQWATQVLEYDEAKNRTDAEIEKMVEDYRRSLYVHKYEQKMVSRHRPEQWPDSLIDNVYDTNEERLRLRESIVKGVMLVLPQGTPKMTQLKGWLGKLNETNVEKIEKYAFQYASGYEYFPNEWRSVNQILLRLPIETDILTEQLGKHSQIVMEDSVSVYILQVTDKRLAGDVMPKDYARETIEQILLNRWQVTYLEQHRQDLFDEAVRFKKLKIYEN